MTQTNQAVLGWRLAHADGTSKHQHTPQQVGQTYAAPFRACLYQKSIAVGHFGFHAAPLPLDLLLYASSTFVERVRLSGDLDHFCGLVAASKRTSLWRADAAYTLLEFAIDAATRAVLAQPGFTEQPARASEQWLAEEAIGDARNFLSGAASALDIETFANAHVRPGNHDAPFGEKMALKAAYHALRACSLHHKGDMALLGELDSGLRRATDAVSCASKGRGAWQAERDWQNQMLHDRLMKLCPKGYKENDNG